MSQEGAQQAAFALAAPGWYFRVMSEKDIRELAATRGPAALDVLEEVMGDPMAEDRDRVRAAEALLDRGYGKPAQAIIAIPPSRRQAAALAAMTDDQLVAVIQQKRLPSLARPQPLITVNPKKSLYSGHGPAADEAQHAVDPLLL